MAKKAKTPKLTLVQDAAVNGLTALLELYRGGVLVEKEAAKRAIVGLYLALNNESVDVERFRDDLHLLASKEASHNKKPSPFLNVTPLQGVALNVLATMIDLYREGRLLEKDEEAKWEILELYAVLRLEGIDVSNFDEDREAIHKELPEDDEDE